MIKAISLLSGGLDSILATKVILNQGVEIEAVAFASAFFSSDSSKYAAGQLRVKFNTFDISNEILDIVKKPKHGYGSNINPCIDCHAFMFKKAARYMKETGASFLITGEVLGERPMSQRKDILRLIEKESQAEGLILRPLSAKLLEPTIPEKKGWVDREKLLAIKGRSRKPQIQLAKDFGIKEYPTPAGGCLLTDPGFAGRLKDLMKSNAEFSVNDVQLLKIGRHFRISPKTKLIVGRNQTENNKLLSLAGDGDFYFYPAKAKGPDAVGRGEFSNEQLRIACSVIARYSDKASSEQEIEIVYKCIPKQGTAIMKTMPAKEEGLAQMRI